MLILLVYVVSVVPVNISFSQNLPDKGYSSADGFDLFVDFLFGIDLVINFISSYEDSHGLPVVSLKKIAWKYVSSWFIIDLIATFPTQVIEDAFKADDGSGGANAKNLKIVRLARLPRLYKLIRLLRMLKMLRVARKQAALKEWLNNLNISVGLIRLLKLIVI
jgi:hypothetical protein